MSASIAALTGSVCSLAGAILETDVDRLVSWMTRSTTLTRSRLFWSLDAEASGCQYKVRITYEVDVWDAGDFITPPTGGEAVLTEVEVLQVQHFDVNGNVSGVEIGDAARRYVQHAWEFVDEGLVSRIQG